MDEKTRCIIDHFFTPPSVLEDAAALGDLYSTLYLLRRDLFDCFGFGRGEMDVNRIQEGRQYGRIIIGTIGICSGIDLLGKLYAGQDEIGGVGDRFKAFASRFLGLSEEDADYLYAFRNSLAHSYGLHSGKSLSLVLSNPRDPETPVVTRQVDRVLIAVMPLHIAFETAVGRYRAALLDDGDLLRKFQAIIPKYASIAIRMPPAPSSSPAVLGSDDPPFSAAVSVDDRTRCSALEGCAGPTDGGVVVGRNLAALLGEDKIAPSTKPSIRLMPPT